MSSKLSVMKVISEMTRKSYTVVSVNLKHNVHPFLHFLHVILKADTSLKYWRLMATFHHCVPVRWNLTPELSSNKNCQIQNPNLHGIQCVCVCVNMFFFLLLVYIAHSEGITFVAHVCGLVMSLQEDDMPLWHYRQASFKVTPRNVILI
jgi:hypothetical protein